MAQFTPIKQFVFPDLKFYYALDNYSYIKPSVIADNIKTLQDIKSTYGTYIDKWAGVFEIGVPVLTTFIAVESTGKMVGKNGAGAIGLTQITNVSVREAISRFKNVTGHDLPLEAVAYLKKNASYLLALSPNEQTLSSANTKALEKKMIDDAEFNIMLGALVLRWNLEFTKANQKTHLNKAIIAYNQSPYGRINNYKNQEVQTLTLFKDKVIPKETRNYLAKTLGKKGFLELYAENNL